MSKKALEKFGLNDKESKVYLALLSTGPVSVRKLADKVNINRGTTYDTLKQLMDLGLVNYFLREKNKFFMAEDPEKLLSLIEDKQQKLKVVQRDIEEKIPELRSIYNNASAKPTVRLYEGRGGVRLMLEDLLKNLSAAKDKEYYMYSSADIRKFVYQAYPEFTAERIKNKIKVKVIAIGRGGKLCGLDKRKWLSKLQTSPSYIMFYAGKMTIVSLDKKKRLTTVIFEDQALYQTQKMLFEAIWDKL